MITNQTKLDKQTGKNVSNNFQFVSDIICSLNNSKFIFNDLNEQPQIQLFIEENVLYCQQFDRDNQQWSQRLKLIQDFDITQQIKFPFNNLSNDHIQLADSCFDLTLNNELILKIVNSVQQQTSLQSESGDNELLHKKDKTVNLVFDLLNRSIVIKDFAGTDQLIISKDSLDLQNKKIINTGDCIDSQDVVNKKYLEFYVQSAISELQTQLVQEKYHQSSQIDIINTLVSQGTGGDSHDNGLLHKQDETIKESGFAPQTSQFEQTPEQIIQMSASEGCCAKHDQLTRLQSQLIQQEFTDNLQNTNKQLLDYINKQDAINQQLTKRIEELNKKLEDSNKVISQTLTNKKSQQDADDIKNLKKQLLTQSKDLQTLQQVIQNMQTQQKQEEQKIQEDADPNSTQKKKITRNQSKKSNM